MLGRKQVLARAKRIGVADFGVVGDVSAALVAVLDGELSPLVPPARTELNDLAGADPSGLVLTVTLYEILEDPTSRNRPPVRESNGETIVTRKLTLAQLRSGPECGGRSKSPIGCRSTTRSGSSTWTR